MLHILDTTKNIIKNLSLALSHQLQNVDDDIL